MSLCKIYPKDKARTFELLRWLPKNERKNLYNVRIWSERMNLDVNKDVWSVIIKIIVDLCKHEITLLNWIDKKCFKGIVNNPLIFACDFTSCIFNIHINKLDMSYYIVEIPYNTSFRFGCKLPDIAIGFIDYACQLSFDDIDMIDEKRCKTQIITTHKTFTFDFVNGIALTKECITPVHVIIDPEVFPIPSSALNFVNIKCTPFHATKSSIAKFLVAVVDCTTLAPLLGDTIIYKKLHYVRGLVGLK